MRRLCSVTSWLMARRASRTCWVALLLPLGLTPTQALAQTQTPSAAATRAPGALTHDGFYLRFATGFGAYEENAVSGRRDAYGGRLQTHTRGFAVAGEFAIGGTPFDGFVIAAGVASVEVYTSSVTFNKNADQAEELGIESRDFTVAGVFLDRYFVPTLGVHVQATLGVANQLGLSVDGSPVGKNEYSPVGPGLMLGLGYEMWIADEWSLGILARFGGGVLFGHDKNHVPWVHTVTALPTFLMTVTYH